MRLRGFSRLWGTWSLMDLIIQLGYSASSFMFGTIQESLLSLLDWQFFIAGKSPEGGLGTNSQAV